MSDDTGVYFVVCGCQRHGNIVMRGGTMSNDILCKSMAYDAARVLYRKEYIDATEFDQIMYEIRCSLLPHRLDDHLLHLVKTDAALDHMLAVSPALNLDPWRTPRSTTREECIESIHSFLDTFAPETRQNLQ